MANASDNLLADGILRRFVIGVVVRQQKKIFVPKPILKNSPLNVHLKVRPGLNVFTLKKCLDRSRCTNL